MHVISGRHTAIERLLDELGGAEARRTVRCRVADAVFLDSVDIDFPGRNGSRVSDAHAARRYVEKFRDEIPNIRGWYP